MSEWDLTMLTTGERSALRRAAGSTGYDVAARRAFYRADLSGDKNYEDARYAAMCFACIWREQDGGELLPMEECLRRLCRNEDGSIVGGMAARVDALLETRWERDDFLLGKLLNLMKLLHSKGETKPDFEELARDLKRWDYDEHPVQRRWLRAVYQNRRDDQGTKSVEDKKDAEGKDHDA